MAKVNNEERVQVTRVILALDDLGVSRKLNAQLTRRIVPGARTTNKSVSSTIYRAKNKAA